MGSLNIVLGVFLISAPSLALGGTPRNECGGELCATHVDSLLQHTSITASSRKDVVEITSSSNGHKEEDEETDKGKDEDDDNHDDELDEAAEGSHKQAVAVNCEWSHNRRRVATMNSCHSNCKDEPACYGFDASRSEPPSPSLLESNKSSAARRRRRRCWALTGSGCAGIAKRCNMPAGKLCSNQIGDKTNLLSGTTCKPWCAAGFSPSFDAPTSLTCTNGNLGDFDYECLNNNVVGKLEVKVLNAINLEDGADGYVRARVGYGNEKKTKVIDNNENPEWNEVLGFDISSRADKLTLTVMDEDIWFDDVLGTVTVDLREIIQTGEAAVKEYPLYKDTEKLVVKLTYA